MSAQLEVIRRYYAACNTADADRLSATMTEDFAHYFLAPNRGSRARLSPADLAETTAKSVSLLGSHWTIDRFIEQGERAAIEYAMHWTPLETGMPTLMRGSEWYDFTGGRMLGVRSYHQVTASVTDLEGFDYDARAYGDGKRDGLDLAVSGGPPQPSRLPVITAYYDACTTGDADELQGFFTDDVVHYFLQPNVGSKPVAGAEHLARYWRKVARMLRARWVVESLIEQGDEAVIEWSMYWNPGPGRPRIVTRGTEWFVFAGERIAQIRSYHKQADESSELDGFDYAERGFSTLERESSVLHDAAGVALSEPLEDSQRR